MILLNSVRNTAFCVNKGSFLLRTEKWAYIQHKENASGGIQLYDMKKDPKQYTNLAENPEYLIIFFLLLFLFLFISTGFQVGQIIFKNINFFH